MVANAQEFWQGKGAVEEQRGPEEILVSGFAPVYRTRALGHGAKAGSSCLALGYLERARAPHRGAHCQDGRVASSSMAAQVTNTSIWHINADEPSILGYNTESSHPVR
jgi:hypothetical protein